MPANVTGLVDFLRRAGIDEKRYGNEARAFCEEQGAITICEVLEDDDLLQAFAQHLQLKRLEQRRCDTAAADFRAGTWTPVAAAEDAETQPSVGQGYTANVSYTPTLNDAAAIPQTEPAQTGSVAANTGRSERLFRTGSSWSSRGRGGGGGHRAARADAAPSRPQMRNHYFDQEEELQPDAGNDAGEHYFKQQSREPASASTNAGEHYFKQQSREPASASTKSSKGGARGALFCGSCGSPYDSEEKFCRQCGQARFTNAVAAEAQQVRGDRHAFTTSSASGPPSGNVRQRAGCADTDAQSSHYFVEANESAAPEFAQSRTSKQQSRSSAAPAQPTRRDDPAIPPKASVLGALEEKKRQDEEARIAKREAARQRRRQQDKGAPAERRIDPDDGKAYTLDEFRDHHAGNFPEAEILEYWDKNCRVAPEQSSHQAIPEPHQKQEAEERRVDPDDGCRYTYEELRRRYARSFSEKEIRAYWRDECVAATGSVGRW